MASGTAGRSRRAVLAYVSVVHVLALAAMLSICARPGVSLDVPPAQIAFWLFFTLAAELFWLATPSKEGMVSMSLAVNVATLYVLPPHLAVVVAAVAPTARGRVIQRRGPRKNTVKATPTARPGAGRARSGWISIRGPSSWRDGTADSTAAQPSSGVAT